jgi:hypothetical protein
VTSTAPERWTWETLAPVDRATLERVFEAGVRPDPDLLDGRTYRGWNRGGVIGLVAEKFRKTFYTEGGEHWGANLVVRQDRQAWRGAWEPKLNHGRPVAQGHYRVRPEPRTLHLDYNVARNTGLEFPLRVIQDDIVLVNPGDYDLVLGKAHVQLGPIRVFVCFFQLGVPPE